MRYYSAFRVAIAANMIGFTVAQNSSSFTGYNWQNTQYPYTLTTAQAAAINATEKNGWCRAQHDTCYQICDNRYAVNDCTISADNGTVLWACQCQGFQTPNITQFGQTVISFECSAYRNICIENSTNNGTASQACAAIQCPMGDAVAAQSSVASSLAAAMATTASTSSSRSPVTTTAQSNTAAATSTGAAYPVHDSGYIGSGVIAAGLVGILGVAL